MQLRDIVALAPDDAAVVLAKSIAENGEVVDAAFVHALRRLDLSQEALNALVLTMKILYMKAHDECTRPSSAMMLASIVFLHKSAPFCACRWVQFSSVSSSKCAKKSLQLRCHSFYITFRVRSLRQAQRSEAID
jgi:hypothetical protein